MGGRSETTLQFLYEFIRTVKNLGFQAVQNGEERTPWTLAVHRVQHHTLLLTRAFPSSLELWKLGFCDFSI